MENSQKDVIVGEQWLVLSKIGEGSFGEVFKGNSKKKMRALIIFVTQSIIIKLKKPKILILVVFMLLKENHWILNILSYVMKVEYTTH